jgi:hypothetical protein
MKNVSAALVKAQKQFGPALKSSTNPHFKSKYADLAACVEAVIEALNASGIALMQRTIECADGVTVETVFVHESGETLSSGPLHVPAAKHDPQGYGSALTYARRYSLMAACGIAPEDDDGNAGTKSAPQARSRVAPPKNGAHADALAAGEPLPADQKAYLDELADRVCTSFDANGEDGARVAFNMIDAEGLDNVQKIYLSAVLPSGVRNPIKAHSIAVHEAEREAARKKALAAKHPAIAAGQPA